MVVTIVRLEAAAWPFRAGPDRVGSTNVCWTCATGYGVGGRVVVVGAGIVVVGAGTVVVDPAARCLAFIGGARAAVRVARSAGIHGPAPSSCSTILIPCRHCSPRPGASRRRMQARFAELARRIMSHDVATSMHRSLACRQVRTTAESEFQSSDALVESHASAHRCLLRGAEQPRGGAATSRTVAVH